MKILSCLRSGFSHICNVPLGIWAIAICLGLGIWLDVSNLGWVILLGLLALPPVWGLMLALPRAWDVLRSALARVSGRLQPRIDEVKPVSNDADEAEETPYYGALYGVLGFYALAWAVVTLFPVFSFENCRLPIPFRETTPSETVVFTLIALHALVTGILLITHYHWARWGCLPLPQIPKGPAPPGTGATHAPDVFRLLFFILIALGPTVYMDIMCGRLLDKTTIVWKPEFERQWKDHWKTGFQMDEKYELKGFDELFHGDPTALNLARAEKPTTNWSDDTNWRWRGTSNEFVPGSGKDIEGNPKPPTPVLISAWPIRQPRLHLVLSALLSFWALVLLCVGIFRVRKTEAPILNKGSEPALNEASDIVVKYGTLVNELSRLLSKDILQKQVQMRIPVGAIFKLKNGLTRDFLGTTDEVKKWLAPPGEGFDPTTARWTIADGRDATGSLFVKQRLEDPNLGTSKQGELSLVPDFPSEPTYTFLIKINP